MISSGPGLSPELTVHLVMGEISAEEILATARTFLSNSPSRLSLWDFSGADFSLLDVSELDPLFNALRPYVHVRTGGKTALVFSTTEGFGLGRMCEALAEIRMFPMSLKAFDSREEARRWLLVDEAEEESKAEGTGVA